METTHRRPKQRSPALAGARKPVLARVELLSGTCNLPGTPAPQGLTP